LAGQADHTDILVSTPRAGVTLITLNRPRALNALRSQLLFELKEALTAAAGDDSQRCVVLTGNERAFAAGADIGELSNHDLISIMQDTRLAAWDVLRKFPKPLIAAVNGYCLGGGCELAMVCDTIIAGEDARFGQPEVNLGILPGAGGTQRLTRVVGKALAMKMCLSGEMIDAATALRAGLVAEVVPAELALERALDLAEVIAAKPPVAVRLIKESILKAYDTPMEAGLDFERRAFTVLFATEDKAEGTRAFVEKRKPVFKGR